MSLGSIIIQHNPVVNTPPGGTYNLSLSPTGIVRFTPNSYQHKIKDMGGFWTCKFDIITSDEIAGELMDNGLGREVRTYNHQGLLGWEGVITTMREATRTRTRIETLERAANKIKVRISVEQISKQVTDVVNDTDMQNQYGILETVDSLEVPVSDLLRGKTRANLLRDDLADPHRLKDFRDKGDIKLRRGMSKVTVFCSGYYWYLIRRLYSSSTRGDANASTVVSAIISGVGQFVNTSDIETNTQQAKQRYNNDDFAWDVLTRLSETGDTSDVRFLSGMKENRKFVYGQRAASTLVNISLYKDANNNITTQSGRPIAGMLAKPNTYLRNVSVKNKPGRVYTDVWDDPQVAYISEVAYLEKGRKTRLTSENAVAKPITSIIDLRKFIRGR